MPSGESGRRPLVTTVAVTGATGIFGKALCALLQDDPRVDRIVGVARRPFDPGRHGWTKMVFRSADVQDPDALDDAFAGADVVCHLAYAVLSRGMPEERIRQINVDGSRNVFAAAVRAGASRLVYASSIAAYGAHPDNPVPIAEDFPTRGNDHFYYSHHKSQVEAILDELPASNSSRSSGSGPASWSARTPSTCSAARCPCRWPGCSCHLPCRGPFRTRVSRRSSWSTRTTSQRSSASP
jgi:putative NADH-flavin reductase